ncbi:MAG TPA: MFS transporter, partial [Phenylobacterium sp.]|nr:MFS transporter [Phenylobacterium sp.]
MTAVFAVLSAMSLVVLDAGMLNVALPVLSERLAVAPSQAILAVTAYQAGLVMALLPAGALGERFGLRRIFVLGVSLFALASLACAAAPGLGWLVAARLIQGLGGAALMVVPRAIIRDLYTGPAATRLMAAVMMVISVSPMLAPLAGAGLMAVAGWRAIFGALVVAAAISL